MAIITFDYFSQERHGFVSVNAILPFDPPTVEVGQPMAYHEGPYRTIYLLHGYTGNRNDWLVRTNIELWAMQQGLAVIMPDGANYFYLDNETTEEYFGRFVGEELVSVTRKLFPLSHERQDTVLGGLSMGGFGALQNGLKYADTFGAVVALSSAFITDEVAVMKAGDRNPVAPYGYYRHTFGDLSTVKGSERDPRYWAKQRVGDPNRPRLFLACGSEDFLYPNNEALHRYFESIGYPHAWWVQPGIHDFDFWNRAIQAAIGWFLE